MLQLSEEINRLEIMSHNPDIKISDFLTEDLLYLLPFPHGSNEDKDPHSCKLTRRHTPKYVFIR